MAAIVIEELTKEFRNGIRAVDQLTFEIPDGEFMVLLGPSGCGKTTLLRMIAGLEAPTSGRILIDGHDVSSVPPEDRDIAMVFQTYALYPHMTVAQNLAFGLRMRRTPKKEMESRIKSVADLLGLDSLMMRKPRELSGGQRQRVAMGRAIVRNPKAFLMDEPLSNLDAKLRGSMRTELARLQSQLGITTVYVTHDQIEAMSLGTSVAVIRDGTLQQVDRPSRLFHRPSNVFVASFVGSPQMNLARAAIQAGALQLGPHRLELPSNAALLDAGEVIAGIRPSDFEVATATTPRNLPTLPAVPELVDDLGSELLIVFTLDAERVRADTLGIGGDRSGEPDDVLLAGDRRARFAAQLSSHRQVAAGEPITLAVHIDRLHLFDPTTGDRIPFGVATEAEAAKSSLGRSS